MPDHEMPPDSLPVTPDVTAVNPEASGLAPVPLVQEEYEPTEEEAARMRGLLDASDDDEAHVDEHEAASLPVAAYTWCELEAKIDWIWKRERSALNNRSVHFLNAIRLRIHEMAEAEKTEAML